MPQRLLNSRQPILANDNMLPILRRILIIRPTLRDPQRTPQKLLRRIETIPLPAVPPERLLPLHEGLVSHRLPESPAH